MFASLQGEGQSMRNFKTFHNYSYFESGTELLREVGVNYVLLIFQL